MAMIFDYLMHGIRFSLVYLGGSGLVLIGFVLVNISYYQQESASQSSTSVAAPPLFDGEGHEVFSRRLGHDRLGLRCSDSPGTDLIPPLPRFVPATLYCLAPTKTLSLELSNVSVRYFFIRFFFTELKFIMIITLHYYHLLLLLLL